MTFEFRYSIVATVVVVVDVLVVMRSSLLLALLPPAARVAGVRMLRVLLGLHPGLRCELRMRFADVADQDNSFLYRVTSLCASSARIDCVLVVETTAHRVPFNNPDAHDVEDI